MNVPSRLLIAATALFATASMALADDLEKLAGKWSLDKTTDDGRKYSQVIEINKDKLKFRMLDSNKELRLYAEGTIKLEKLGPFSVMKVTDIKGGQSETDLQPVDDDRTNVYQLGYDTWAMATNFDKERDQKPGVDLYKKVK